MLNLVSYYLLYAYKFYECVSGNFVSADFGKITSYKNRKFRTLLCRAGEFFLEDVFSSVLFEGIDLPDLSRLYISVCVCNTAILPLLYEYISHHNNESKNHIIHFHAIVQCQFVWPECSFL